MFMYVTQLSQRRRSHDSLCPTPADDPPRSVTMLARSRTCSGCSFNSEQDVEAATFNWCWCSFSTTGLHPASPGETDKCMLTNDWTFKVHRHVLSSTTIFRRHQTRNQTYPKGGSYSFPLSSLLPSSSLPIPSLPLPFPPFPLEVGFLKSS